MKRATSPAETSQIGRSVERLESWLKVGGRAEYVELPAVYDEVEAMTSKAIVHDVLKPAGTFPDLKHLKGKSNTNLALDFRLRRGDAERAMAGAARVFEHRFRTQQVMHTPLEPLVSV